MSDGRGLAGNGEEDLGIIPGLVSSSGRIPTPIGRPAAPAFDLVLRGYDRRQVDARLAELEGRVTELSAALEAARQSEASALATAQRARAELERGRPSFDTLGERVAEMLRLAEVEAAEMRAAGEQDAAASREAGERDAQDYRRTAERQVEALLRSWTGVLAQVSTARDDLDGILAASRSIDITEATTSDRSG